MTSNPDNTGTGRKKIWWYAAILGLYLVVFAPQTKAHEGPPFPIIIDHEVGPYLVSVWTDPDIGIGTFFIVFEPNPDASERLTTDITSVSVGVEPTSGRLSEKIYTAEQQPTRNGARYFSEVAFDAGEMWKVRVIIEGSGWREELISEVEATPDGTIGPIAILIYALPFIGIGVIWIRAIIVRRREE